MLAEKGKGLECAHCKVCTLQDTQITAVQGGLDENLRCHSGEEAIALLMDGKIHQGGISRALGVAVGTRRLEQLKKGESKRGQEWHAAKECSYTPARKSAMEADTSRRFKVRAWADCLPTYQNISRRSRGDGPNIYKVVYGDGDDFHGHCLRCGDQCVESMQHNVMLCDCPVGANARRELLMAIAGKWEDAGLGEEWAQGNWLQPDTAIKFEVHARMAGLVGLGWASAMACCRAHIEPG